MDQKLKKRPEWIKEDDRGRKIVDVAKFGDDILKNHRFIWLTDQSTSTLYIYDSNPRSATVGTWYRPADKYIAHIVTKKLYEYHIWSYTSERDAKKYINDSIPIILATNTFDKINPNLIYFRNGIWDLQHPDNKLLNHNPNFFILNSRDYDITINPQAKAEVTNKWLWASLGQQYDALKLFKTLIGYTFYAGWYPGFNTFQILIGEGGDGKSTILNFISSLIGQKALINLPFETVTGNAQRFEISELRYKLMNSYSDISAQYIADLALLKMLTGNDQIAATQKFKETIDFKPYAKMWFAGNNLPEIGKISMAEERRAKIFSITKLSEAQLKEYYDPQKIKEERGVFARECLMLLHQAMQDGHLPDCKMTNENREKWKLTSDIVQQWMKDCCTTQPDDKDFSSHLYGLYIKYCNINGYKKRLSRPQLVQDLKKKGFQKKNSVRIGEKVASGLFGIHAKNDWT